MRPAFSGLFFYLGLILFVSAVAFGQSSDAPSLGDIARQQREKQKAKSAEAPPKVITNESLPEHSEPLTSDSANEDQAEDSGSKSLGSKSAEQWAAGISAKKKEVENLQSQMEKLNSSIHFAPGNCVRNCVQWNERQEQKQEQVERMQKQLEQQKKELEDMQEAARKEGFGNSVYEPQ